MDKAFIKFYSATITVANLGVSNFWVDELESFLNVSNCCTIINITAILIGCVYDRLLT